MWVRQQSRTCKHGGRSGCNAASSPAAGCRVHVGEVCANVVGRISPKYTLLGDTMNTSSRMESTAPAGYIQLTDDAARLLRAQDSILAGALHERGYMVAQTCCSVMLTDCLLLASSLSKGRVSSQRTGSFDTISKHRHLILMNLSQHRRHRCPHRCQPFTKKTMMTSWSQTLPAPAEPFEIAGAASLHILQQIFCVATATIFESQPGYGEQNQSANI